MSKREYAKIEERQYEKRELDVGGKLNGMKRA
jgi:hypothetical protein